MIKKNKQRIERRRFPRVMAPVFYRIPKMQRDMQHVSNLSLGGVRIYSNERLDVGQILELEFSLPNGSLVEAKARVVWIKELPPGSIELYDVGMEFFLLPEKALKKIQAVLK